MPADLRRVLAEKNRNLTCWTPVDPQYSNDWLIDSLID